MKLYILIILFLHIFIIAQAQTTEKLIEAGGAIDSLRQNNAVVGILYLLVVVQSGVIVKLWLKTNKINDERLADLKERIKSEEDLRKEIQEVYTKHNLNK